MRSEVNTSESGLPAVAVGVGLRHSHMQAFLDERPATGFLEVHSENYFSDGGPRRRALDILRQAYPISLHGVGLSLGSAEGLSADHLARLASLAAEIEPALLSEHLSWSVAEGQYLNDLLPLPYTEESLAVVCANIARAQDAVKRQILLENPSSYLEFADSVIPEAEFLAEIVRRSGCGLLLDVNNIYVTARNHGLDASAYLAALLGEAVGEIHLAGHARRDVGGETLLIDDHGSAVADPVWTLYEETLTLIGPRPTLIEWDSNLPPLAVLLGEAEKARALIARHASGERSNAA